ncbi:flagellar basal body-associated protein FliL, partial [Jeotgalibaca porci]
KIYIKVPYSEFLINLKPLTQNDKSFLRMAFTFAVADEEKETILLEEEAKVRDTIIALLRKKTSESVFNEENSNLTIKQEVEEQVNQLLGDSVVEEVFITDMVMQ